MKIEQLLVQHFYNAKEVTLQGMGTFTLSHDFVIPKETDKDFHIPENTISFQYNQRATEDTALIDFIASHSGKMKQLAAGDLESYLELGKQFLNIGKPFNLEGIGTLLKNQQGEFVFTQGTNFAPKTETIAPANIHKVDLEEPSISFASKNKTTPNRKKGLLIAALMVTTGLIASTVWYFFIHKKNKTEIVNVQPAEPANDSSKNTAQQKPDTTLTVAATTTATTTPTSPYTFKVVFMVTPDSALAAARMKKYITRGHTVIMYKKDSLNYSLAEPFTLPLSDTTHVKDSLNSFYFSGKAFIELK